MPNAYFLIPGYGAQGGKAEDIGLGFSNRTRRNSKRIKKPYGSIQIRHMERQIQRRKL
jgi:hypothetical protein